MKRIRIRTFASFLGIIFLLILYVVYLQYDGSRISKGEPIPVYNNPKAALFVIDIQAGTTGPLSITETYQTQAGSLIQNLNSLILDADSLGMPVVYIKQQTDNWLLNAASDNLLARDFPGVELDKRLEVVTDFIFTKEIMDAFSNKELDIFLREKSINKIYITGLDAAYCVNRTAHAAKNRGYEITVIEDALISETDSLKKEMIEEFKSSGMTVIQSTAFNQSTKQGPGTYRVQNDRDAIVLPFEFYGMNLKVQAKMNGINIKMLIDNGVMWDELLFYGSAQVDSLGMNYEGDILVVGAGEGDGINSYTASNVSLSFGDITFNGQVAVITPKEQGFADFFPGIAGQVCGAFFKHFIVEFNFDTQMMILHKPQNFKYEGKGNFVKMTRDSSGAYSIPVQIKQKDKQTIAYNLFIDLGGIYPVSLVINKKQGFDKPDSEKILLGYGASGEINGYKGILEQLRIANYELNEVMAVYTESSEESDHTNTTIGLPLLMRFNLVFDYFNEKVYLEPNRHFDEPYTE